MSAAPAPFVLLRSFANRLAAFRFAAPGTYGFPGPAPMPRLVSLRCSGSPAVCLHGSTSLRLPGPTPKAAPCLVPRLRKPSGLHNAPAFVLLRGPRNPPVSSVATGTGGFQEPTRKPRLVSLRSPGSPWPLPCSMPGLPGRSPGQTRQSLLYVGDSPVAFHRIPEITLCFSQKIFHIFASLFHRPVV